MHVAVTRRYTGNLDGNGTEGFDEKVYGAKERAAGWKTILKPHSSRTYDSDAM
jgi:hypothetical protein